VILKPLHRQRQISSGKSAQFPATYNASTAYHTPRCRDHRRSDRSQRGGHHD
jgi:hypothetical protein